MPMSTTEEPVEWPEPQPDPEEEPAESLDNDGTPGTGTIEEEAE
jgi:hypothetical protein